MKDQEPFESEDISLHDARKVNKRLRAQRKAERKRASQEKCFGIFQDIVAEVVHAHKGDPKTQIARFLERANKRGIPSRTGRQRPMGEARKTEFGRTLFAAVEDLKAAGHPIQNISEFGEKHVIHLVRYWGEVKKLSEGSIQNMVSAFRSFLTFAGKEISKCNDWRSKLRDRGIVAGTVGRSNVAVIEKGWRDLGHDVDGIIELAKSMCEIVACQLLLMYLFGLRCEECRQFAPFWSDKGSYIAVLFGTKGKKLRHVDFSSDPERAARQREALDWAKRLAMKHPAKDPKKKRLAPAGLTLKQHENYQRHIFRKLGIFGNVKKGGRGITPHGLRHQFACDVFKEKTGLPAPVLGLLPAEEYERQAELVNAALLYISEQLGHERACITFAYTGSERTMAREQKECIDDMLDKIEAAFPGLRAAGVESLWLTGRAASGLKLAAGECVSVLVRLRGNCDMTIAQVGERVDAARVAIEVALDRKVAASPWIGNHTPPETVEVMYTFDRGPGDLS